MSNLDITIIGLYFAFMIGVGLYFLRRQTTPDEYFVGNRRMGTGHVGLSVVATDVGGGFSIGLGGLGFAMGLAGSWLLFTGLIGAWLAAVIVIPRVKPLGDKHGWLTFPDFLEHRYDGRTRTLAALVSGIGYAAFVGGQVLAGATLASVAFDLDLTTAVLVMAAVVIVYTAMGGLEAVVYTDTIQWIVLFAGLLFLGIPFAWVEVGGWDAVKAAVPEGHLSLTNVGISTLLAWMVTIIPIWFVGNTLYQRIYASRDVKSAQRAWYMAGLLEWPLMAFMGVFLGLFARVLFPEAEPEAGLPMLIRDVLPVGITGLVLAVYFSAIMSTADSCLLASVGHFITDLYERRLARPASKETLLRLSRVLTLVLGSLSVGVALAMPRVLDAILLAYSFMVSGLFVPTIAGLMWRRASSVAAFWSMLSGGLTVVSLNLFPSLSPTEEPVLIAMPVSALVMVALTLVRPADGNTSERDPGEQRDSA